MSLLPLYWLNLEGAAPPVVVTPLRRLTLTLREGNNLTLVLSETMSITQNVSCIAGEALLITATFDVPPAWDISTAGLAFYLKKAYSDTVALVTKTRGAGITPGPDTTKQLQITLAHVDTLQTPGNYVYDVWHTDSGQETTLAHGRLSIGPAVRPSP